ncbi:MAG: hypothetical protein ACP5OG_00105 [Candidatus Nanoarchaeia archaeon]
MEELKYDQEDIIIPPNWESFPYPGKNPDRLPKYEEYQQKILDKSKLNLSIAYDYLLRWDIDEPNKRKAFKNLQSDYSSNDKRFISMICSIREPISKKAIGELEASIMKSLTEMNRFNILGIFPERETILPNYLLIEKDSKGILKLYFDEFFIKGDCQMDIPNCFIYATSQINLAELSTKIKTNLNSNWNLPKESLDYSKESLDFYQKRLNEYFDSA